MARESDAGTVLVHPSLLLVPLVILLAVAVERRSGPAAAGVVTALPVGPLLGVVLTARDAGVDTAATLAGNLGAHVIAQVCAVLVLLIGARRLPPLHAFLAACLAYGAAALVVAALPLVVALMVGAPLLLAGRWWGSRGERVPHSPGPAPLTAWSLVLRALVGWLAVILLVTASDVLGPQLGAAVGAFPAVTTYLGVLVWREHGAAGARAVAASLLRTLPGYLAFCVTFVSTSQVLPLPQAVGCSVIAAAATLALVLRASSLRRPGLRLGQETPRLRHLEVVAQRLPDPAQRHTLVNRLVDGAVLQRVHVVRPGHHAGIGRAKLLLHQRPELR